jgi:hypothetical protein
MDLIKWTYFQFRKQYDYKIFIRFKAEDLNAKFNHLLTELGFSEMSEKDSKKISLTQAQTKVLTVQYASARLNQMINGSDILDKFGAESLSLQAGVPVYTYRKVGLMGVPMQKNLWDLALNSDLSQTDQMVGLRIMLVRYLSLSLSEQGVLSYWGTVKEGSVLVMKQAQSFGEAVFIDWNKKVIFSNGGETKCHSQIKMIRMDKEQKTSGYMGREEIISFLSVSTCLLSFQGISQAMKRSILELSGNLSATYSVSESSVNL